MSIELYRAEMRRLAANAQVIATDKKSSGGQKRADLEKITVQIKDYSDKIYVIEQAQKMAGGMGTVNSMFGATTKNIPSAATPLIVDEDTMHGLFEAVMSHKSFQGRVGTKSPSVLGSADAIPFMSSFVGLQHEQVRLLDLFPSEAVGSPVIEYLRHDTTTGAAGTVLPGGLKPSAVLNVSRQIVNVSKLAVLGTVNDEDLADFPAFAAYLQNQLMMSVIDAENSQILSGDGTAPDMLGILNETGLLTRTTGAAPDTDLDAIEEAIADLRSGPAFTEPDALILNPLDYSKIRRIKNTLGNYVATSDPNSGPSNTLWGVPVKTTTTMPVGTALLGNMALACRAWVREGITISADYGTAGFEHNQTTVRVEERLAAVAELPSALVKITLT